MTPNQPLIRTAKSAAPEPAGPQSWQRRLLTKYLQVQVFWNPVLCAAAVLTLGSLATFTRSFAAACVVAAVASSVSFAAVAAVLAFEQLQRARGRGGPAHGTGFYVGVALLGMPIGLLLAGQVTEALLGVRTPGSAYDYRFGIFLGLLLAGIFSLWQGLSEARSLALKLELRVERAETHRLQAQLSALTAQLNPHLMFNALNTIAELIQTNAAQAERTLLRLSALYRGVLRATQRDQHSLEDELEICRAYLDVEQARFQDRLATQVDVASDLDARHVQVPVLVLQPLVENALTHGLLDRAQGGSVSIGARARGDTLELEVRDDGVGLGQSSRNGCGLGIENTRRRLLLRYGAGAGLELSSLGPGGTLARLRLPLEMA